VERQIVILQTDTPPAEMAEALSYLPEEFNHLFFFILPLKDKLLSKQELLEALQQLVHNE